MAIRINQNIISLLIQKNLNKVSDRLQTSFERISSGERIRRSSDDPTGLSSSQQVRYEIAGLQRNQQNVSGALSLVGTAESGITGIQASLQRARELLVQAANDTLQPDQRQAIQSELNTILAEIDRVASESNHLGQRLLDGTFIQKTIQVGTQTGQNLGLSIRSFRVSEFGQVAKAAGTSGVDQNAIQGTGDLTINGVTVPASTADSVSTVSPNASGIAKARAINAIKFQTGVSATVEPTQVLTPGATISAVFVDGISNKLTINGVSIGQVVVANGDADGALVKAINAVTRQTGVAASLDTAGALKLTAADGRNIVLTTTGSIADELGLQSANGDLSNAVTTAKVSLSSDVPYGVGGNLALIGFGPGQSSIGLDPTTAIGTIDVTSGAAASAALVRVDSALRQGNETIASIGALQNRLDSLNGSLASRIEELSSADSRIRDTDVAVESARLAQAQILQESALALLAQANATPQTALRLLQQ